MHYSDKPSMVRVDFFKERGKWYATESIKWEGYDGPIHDEFNASLRAHLDGRMSGTWAVCLDPYNHSAFPLMVKVE